MVARQEILALSRLTCTFAKLQIGGAQELFRHIANCDSTRINPGRAILPCSVPSSQMYRGGRQDTRSLIDRYWIGIIAT